MRIGIFDPYLDTLGGGEKYILAAASCLSNTNEVDLFWDKDNDLIKKAQERFEVDLSKIKLVRNIFSPDVSFFSRLVATRKYDLIIFLSDGSIPFTLAKRLILHFQFPVRWVNGKSFINKLKLRKVHKVICYSQFIKYFLDKKFSINSIVLPPGIRPIQSNLGKKENIILTVGRFTKGKVNNKKQQVLIDVFKSMYKKKLSGWRFVLIGSALPDDEDFVWKLKEFVRGYPIEIFHNISFSELYKHYRISKIYWHAAGFGEDLQKYPERAEHFGISTVEAMSASVVPVVINAGGQKEIVQNGKNGFLWSSTEELIEKTRILIQNKKLWENMSNNARTRAQVFSEERFCKELKTILL